LDRHLTPLGVSRVSKRGGSLQVTIPKDASTIMKLTSGDRITFYYDEQGKRITLGKVPREDIEKMVTLEFSLSKEVAKKIIEKKQKTRI